MSSNAAAPTLVRYVVYMPHGPRSMPFPFNIPEDAEVSDLAEAIAQHRNFKPYLERTQLILFKCGDLSTREEETLYPNALEWLRYHPETRNLFFISSLKDYFPAGPSPKDVNKVDIIAITQPILEKLHRPTTPGKKPSASINGTPRRSESDTQLLVDNLLRKYDTKLKEYLSGSPWNVFWKAPPDADPETARFINSLKIPQVLDGPILLLHDLGNGVVDKCITDNVFDGHSRLFVNTSGSGKTRLLFEGLSEHWGFYFSSVVDGITSPLGSMDLKDTVFKYIPRSSQFQEYPELLQPYERDAAYTTNHYIAERRMFQVIRARMLVFEYFWRAIEQMYPSRDVNEFKIHWLFLQLRPSDVLREDVFTDLVDILKDAEDDYLMKRSGGLDKDLFKLQDSFRSLKDFVIVLDEAQVLGEKLARAFRSERDVAITRPVLRPIISALKTASNCPIVVAGTGLSLELVNEVITAAVGKPARFTLTTKTGAFDDPERQRKYILRYMPRHIAESESGKEFLVRAWRWVRGRHRFTATLLDQLLMSSFKTPHRTLNAYIEQFSGFFPSDGRRFVEEETRNGNYRRTPIVPLGFSEIRHAPNHIALISDLLACWLMRQVLLPLNEEKEQLVQLGFARFSDNVGTKAVIDEPLALLAASAELGSMPDFSLGDRIKHRLLLSDGRGEKFKEFIGFYFASAFGDGLDLCNIFDFGEAAPQWSKQGVELVSVSLVGEQVNAYPFHLPSHVGATLSIGKKCSSVEETLDWFKEPSTVLCFPDKLMGPDIVLFVRLACGLILAVLVQIKWISKSNFTKGTQYEALWSIQPSNFYSHKVHKEILYDINNTDYSGLQHLKGQRYSDARTRICEMLRSLNKPHQHIESEGWFEDGLPVLKVAASFPIGAQQGIPPQCASLNMEWCLRAVDSKHLLNTVALALGVFNPLAQEGVGEVSEPPVKKHRFS